MLQLSREALTKQDVPEMWRHKCQAVSTPYGDPFGRVFHIGTKSYPVELEYLFTMRQKVSPNYIRCQWRFTFKIGPVQLPTIWYRPVYCSVGIGELKQRHFWATLVNRKHFPFCLDSTKFVFLNVSSLIETICLKIWSKSRPKLQKDHFRLTCVAQKRRYLSYIV